MHRQAKHLDPNQHAPEVRRQQRDVEKGRRREPEQHRRQRVKGEEDERVADEIAGDGGVPGGVAKGVAVEDGRLRAVDEHGPETELADDFVQRASADEDFFGDVGETVEGGGRDGEEVAFELVGCGAANVVALDVVGRKQDAHATAAEQDAGVLGDVVADVQEDERDCDDDDNGPEVDELGGQNVGVTVRKNDEVVAFNVAECQEQVCVREHVSSN